MPSELPKMPIVVLAGSDRRRGAVPAGGEGFHFLSGYKGAELRVGDRALIQEVVERIRESDAFGEIFVAGPRRIFEELVDCAIVDTDGAVGENVQRAIGEVRERHGDDVRIAFLACDVLPTPREIAELAAALAAPVAAASHAEGRAGGEDPALALSIVRMPDDLGASAWKPTYRIRPANGEEPVAFLPGHLGVACPAKLRTGLLFRSIHLIYQERNRDYEERRRFVLWRLIGSLLWRDLFNLLRLQPPTLTYAALRHGLGAFLAWRRNELILDDLARAIGSVAVRRRHQRLSSTKGVRLVVTPHVSFARDIDTREELEEVARGAGRG